MYREKFKILDRSFVTVKLPVNLEEEDDFFEGCDYTSEEVGAYKFKNVNVSPFGVVFKGLSCVREVRPSVDKPNSYFRRHLSAIYLKRKSVRKEGNYLLAFDDFSHGGYYHWMLETLPKIFSLKEYHDDYVLLLPDRIDKVRAESLKVFGNIKTEIIPKNQYFKIKGELLAIDRIAYKTHHRIEVLKPLRKLFLSHFSAPHVASYEKIFISRKQTERRHIVNEKEVIDVISHFGFKTLYLDEFTLEEQINIFSKAKIVIGIHGAGLSNILFMEKNTKLLELRGRIQNHKGLDFYKLASVLDINYYYQLCEDEDNESYILSNYTIDTDKLKLNLEKLLK